MLSYLTYGYTLILYESSFKYYVCIYTLMWYMQYLLSVTYVFYALALFLGWRLATERMVAQPLHLYLFPQV